MQFTGALPFTGRDEELSALHDVYIGALHNECQLALVEGEPGVGKSTLVEQFLGELGEKGALTLKTFGIPSYGGFRSTFAGMLRSFLSAATPQELSTSNLFERGSATALSRLAPEVRDMIPFEIPESDNLDHGAAQEMEQILDGLRLFILRLATHKPLVLLFEDAHWFDARSWEAINFLKRTLGPYPVMIMVTLRGSELDDEAERIYRTLTHSRPVERIKLDNLSNTDARLVIERMFGAEIADSIAVDVQASTGGNPLFLHETLNTLIERQALHYDRASDQWEQTAEISGKLPEPESAGYIFEERISSFSEEEVDIFRLAALLGLSFWASWLKDLASLPEEKFIGFLNRALKANLLVSDFQGKLTFYHQLIQRHLLESIPEQLRASLRVRMYEYFLARSRSHAAEGPFHHFLACETFEPELVKRHGVKLVENNLDAARDAFASFSNALAIRYLETARRTLGALPDVERSQALSLLFRIYLELGRVALESGHSREAVVYDRCASIYIAPHLTLTLEDQLRLIHSLAEAYYKIAGYPRIAGYVNRAVALAAGVEDNSVVRELAKLQFISGLSLYNQGQYDSASRETEQGLKALAERGMLEPQLELAGLRTKGIILNRIGKHREAEDVFSRSLHLAEALNDRREIGRAQYYLGVVRQYLGQFNQAMADYQQSIAVCREVDDLETMSKIFNNLGVHYSESGDPAQAERNFRRAFELQEQIGAVYASLTTRINIAGALHTSGRTDEALEESRRIYDECVRLNAVNLIPAIYDSEIEIALDADRVDYATKALAEMSDWLKRTESKFGVDHLKKLKARLEILKGNYQEGWKLLSETLKIYRDKGESFRAAQAMAEGAISIVQAQSHGGKVGKKILDEVERYISEALEIYRKLKFTKRIEILRERILSSAEPGSRFAALVGKDAPEKRPVEYVHQNKALVRCFGRLKVISPGRHDEIDESAWPSKKARALLAYLATHTAPDRPVSRDRICDALWSHLGPDTIMSSFHVTLSHLRKTISTESAPEFRDTQLISHQDGNYNVAWNESFWCDLKEFDELYSAASGYLRENKVHLASERFEQARALYQGPLLEDMYDSWLEEPRETYRMKHIDICQRLADIHFEKGEFDRATALCQEILLVDPTEEPAHRLLMLTLFTTGRKAAAVKQYNACVSALKKRLDIEPDQKTIDLAELIKTSASELVDMPPAKAKMRYV
ncbi:MAG: BTAD domain-containing putative transcriptional regulator [Candidatus Zixiibacteriota bacterium]